MSEPFISLQDFIPALSPRFEAPRHLRPMTDQFERIARGAVVKEVTSVPPRKGKTEALKHGGVWLLAQNPELQICYASYSARIAEKKSRSMRELARRAGVPLDPDASSRADWRTGVEDGGVWATSPGGAITGEGFNVIVLDDLIRGRAEAESATARDRIRGWFTMDVLTRLEPGGSVILNGTRWHPDDPAGFAIGLGWPYINLQAITPEGESLWPERWPLDELIKLREELGGVDGYEWQSLYCGNPRARGDAVFNDVHFYDELPDGVQAMQDVIGLDYAYSSSKSADWSTAVVLTRIGDTYYVREVVRVREEPAAFRARVKQLVARYPKARLKAYVAGTERGIIEFFGEAGLHVQTEPASVDKFTRAIPAAAAWNSGKIMVPREAPWLNAFVSELAGFTGVNDPHDDQVDALAAAYVLSKRGGVLAYSKHGRELRRLKQALRPRDIGSAGGRDPMLETGQQYSRRLDREERGGGWSW